MNRSYVTKTRWRRWIVLGPTVCRLNVHFEATEFHIVHASDNHASILRDDTSRHTSRDKKGENNLRIFSMQKQTKNTLDFISDVSGINQSRDLNYFRIFRFFLASTLDPGAAEELTRRCFVKSRRPARKLGSHINPKLWLMKTAVNLVHGYFRRQCFFMRKRPHVNDVKLAEICKWVSRSQGTVEEVRRAQCQVQVIWQVLYQLPLLQRTIFILRYIEELDFLEIAESIGIKQQEVKKGLDDALGLVRKQVYSIED